MPKIVYGLVFLMILAACSQPAAAPTPAPTATPTVTPTPAPSPTPTPVPSPTPAPTATSTPAPAASRTAAGGLSPRQVMERALAAMSEVESFRFELESTVSTSTDGSDAGLPISFAGDFQAPDRIRGKLSLSLGFFSIEMETIVIGDTTYVTNPESGKWEVSPDLAFGVPNPAELAVPGGVALEGLTLVGEETLDGARVYHLKGAPPAGIFGETPDDADADFWIGVDDLRIKQITARGKVSLGDSGGLGLPFGGTDLSGTATITMTLKFSGYNEPVDIEAPQVSS